MAAAEDEQVGDEGAASAPEPPAGKTVEPVTDDTELAVPPDSTGDGEKTEHAPLAQWATRSGGRPQPPIGSTHLQEPIDPWPVPMQGLIPPPDAPPIEDLEALLKAPSAGSAKRTRRLVAILVVAVLALIGGAAGVVARSGSDGEKRQQSFPAPALGTLSSGPTHAAPPSAPDDTEPVPSGAIAQGVDPANVYEMGGICDGQVYWPTLPKYAGKAPHPILVYGDTADSTRLPYTMFDAWFLKAKSAEKTWSYDKSPKVIQLVACVDRVAVGAKVRSCTYGEPLPGKGTLYHATYRVHVHETSTGKKLLDTKLEAKDTSCPHVVGVPADKKLYMEVKTAALLTVLRKVVEK